MILEGPAFKRRVVEELGLSFCKPRGQAHDALARASPVLLLSLR